MGFGQMPIFQSCAGLEFCLRVLIRAYGRDCVFIPLTRNTLKMR